MKLRNRFMLCCIGLMLSTGVHAQEKTVTLQCFGPDDKTREGHRFEVPTVKYDKDEVTISSDTIMYNVHIIIKDVNGNVIYNQKKMIDPAETTLSIPEEYQNDKFTIEIYYKKEYMYGYFE